MRTGLWQSAVASVAEVATYALAYVVLESVLSGQRVEHIPWIAAGAILLAVLVGWFFKARAGLNNFASTYSLVCDVRMRLLEHLRRLPMGFWASRRAGAVSSMLTDEFALYTEIATHVWGMTIAQATFPAVLLILLAIVDWRLAIVAAALVPLALRAVPWSHRLLDRASARLAKVHEESVGTLVEYVQGIETLREYGAVGSQHQALEASQRDLEKEMMRTELAPAPAILMYAFLVHFGFALVVAIGGWLVAEDGLSPLTLVLFLVVGLRFFGSLADLSLFLAEARFASRTLRRLRTVVSTEAQHDVEVGNSPVDASLSVSGVRFAYEEGRPVIDGVDAEFRPGTLTALVGPSGSGKTTLAMLLPRLWDADEGTITLGGVDVRDLPLRELQSHISVVFQDVVLFQGTVEENIRLARPGATRAEVVAAAKAARADEFIATLPLGYDTLLGEGAEDLSGGQRQRLSIARALLKDAPILILDEATSAVDPYNERLIQEALARLVKGRTVIVIAHRLATIQHADQILVLDGGRVVERGTHDDLRAEDGLYERLWVRHQEAARWRL